MLMESFPRFALDKSGSEKTLGLYKGSRLRQGFGEAGL